MINRVFSINHPIKRHPLDTLNFYSQFSFDFYFDSFPIKTPDLMNNVFPPKAKIFISIS